MIYEDFETYKQDTDQIVNLMVRELVRIQERIQPDFYDSLEQMPRPLREAVYWLERHGMIKKRFRGYRLTEREAELYIALYKMARYLSQENK